MRIFVMLNICFDILKLWNHSLLVCGHDHWHDEIYLRRYDHYHGKYSDAELMVDVINNLGLKLLMLRLAFSVLNCVYSFLELSLTNMLFIGDGYWNGYGKLRFDSNHGRHLQWRRLLRRSCVPGDDSDQPGRLFHHVSQWTPAVKAHTAHNEGNDNNIAFSPYGAGVILIALGESLQGEALYEIRRALQLPYDAHTIRVGLRDIHRHLKTYFIPREGFLAGITLNTENVTIKPRYIELLRFYGYDINSFNTALYPETHMTTEMITMIGREETTTAIDAKPEPTVATETSSQETTTNIELKEEGTTSAKPEPTPAMETSTPESTTNTERKEEDTTSSKPEPTTAINTSSPETTTNTDRKEKDTTSAKPEATPAKETITPESTTNTEQKEEDTTSAKPEATPSMETSSLEITTNMEQKGEDTTSAKPEPTPAMNDSNQESTTNIERKEGDTTSAITMTTSELQKTVSASLGEDKPSVLSEAPMLTTENSKTTHTSETLMFTEPSTIRVTESISTSLLPEITTLPSQPSTDNNVEAPTTPSAASEINTSPNAENVITLSIPDISETTTLMLEQTTNPDSENIITPTTDISETTTMVYQHSTTNYSESNITQTVINESEITVTTIPSAQSKGTTEVAFSTQESVTQRFSSETGTVEVLSNGNTNNISLTINNQTVLIPSPRSTATNYSVNLRISTESSDDDLSTTEMIQSRNARSIKYDTIYSPASTYDTNLSTFPSEQELISTKKRLLNFLIYKTYSSTEKVNSVTELLSLTPHYEMNGKNENLQREFEYHKSNVEKIRKPKSLSNNYKNEHWTDKYITIDSNYVEDYERFRPISTTQNKAFDISNYEIQINNTIYVTQDQNNLRSKNENALTRSSREKKMKINYQQIRKPRSLEDYIIARQYDQPHHFRPPKPYIPQERPYFLVDGKKESNLDFMTYDTVLPFLYVQHLGALALAFPLDSDKYYLLLLLPLRDNGLNELVCNIRMHNIFKYIMNNLELTHVKATIPSFNLKGRITLTNSLQKLGIRKIFEPRQADFTPMTDDENIYVTNIEQAISVTIKNYMHRHQSRKDGSQHYYTEPVRFDINRPFLYFVVDSLHQILLMAGKVINPLNVRIK